MITGRKRVEGAREAGMLGLERRQCLRMALKTRNCGGLSGWDLYALDEGMHTCHAKGTFLRFKRISAAAAIRE